MSFIPYPTQKTIPLEQFIQKAQEAEALGNKLLLTPNGEFQLAQRRFLARLVLWINSGFLGSTRLAHWLEAKYLSRLSENEKQEHQTLALAFQASLQSHYQNAAPQDFFKKSNPTLPLSFKYHIQPAQTRAEQQRNRNQQHNNKLAQSFSSELDPHFQSIFKHVRIKRLPSFPSFFSQYKEALLSRIHEAITQHSQEGKYFISESKASEIALEQLHQGIHTLGPAHIQSEWKLPQQEAPLTRNKLTQLWEKLVDSRDSFLSINRLLPEERASFSQKIQTTLADIPSAFPTHGEAETALTPLIQNFIESKLFQQKLNRTFTEGGTGFTISAELRKEVEAGAPLTQEQKRDYENRALQLRKSYHHNQHLIERWTSLQEGYPLFPLTQTTAHRLSLPFAVEKIELHHLVERVQRKLQKIGRVGLHKIEETEAQKIAEQAIETFLNKKKELFEWAGAQHKGYLLQSIVLSHPITTISLLQAIANLQTPTQTLFIHLSNFPLLAEKAFAALQTFLPIIEKEIQAAKLNSPEESMLILESTLELGLRQAKLISRDLSSLHTFLESDDFTHFKNSLLNVENKEESQVLEDFSFNSLLSLLKQKIKEHWDFLGNPS